MDECKPLKDGIPLLVALLSSEQPAICGSAAGAYTRPLFSST